MGFVSNSSSSSYTCDVCGNTESGMDISLQDLEMYECQGGHTICESHSMPLERQDYIKVIEGNDYGDVDSIKDMDDDELAELCESDYDIRYSLPKTNCPVCNLDHIQDYTVLKFIEKELGIEQNYQKKLIKDKFNNLDAVREYLQDA